MKRNTRGIVFYVAMVVLFFLMVLGLYESFGNRNSLTYREFTALLEKGQVTEVDITQNREVPTGILDIRLSSGSTETLNVTDV